MIVLFLIVSAKIITSMLKTFIRVRTLQYFINNLDQYFATINLKKDSYKILYLHILTK